MKNRTKGTEKRNETKGTEQGNETKGTEQRGRNKGDVDGMSHKYVESCQMNYGILKNDYKVF